VAGLSLRCWIDIGNLPGDDRVLLLVGSSAPRRPLTSPHLNDAAAHQKSIATGTAMASRFDCPPGASDSDSYVNEAPAADAAASAIPGPHAAPDGRPIRVALADDSYLVREAIVHVLDTEPGFELVATCEDGESLLAAVEAERPDVVLTDIRMPPSGDDEGITVANRLRATHPEVGVVVVSQYAHPRYGVALLGGGSERRGYLLKERLHDRAQLVGALATVAEGGSVVDSKVVEALISAQIRDESSPLAELTPRELEILSEIAQGKSNQAIAHQLVLSKRAVEKHINAIFLKLDLTRDEDVSRRVKAALIYLSQSSTG
jgi:DNA-binding NarL/FixJ family response regulator